MNGWISFNFIWEDKAAKVKKIKKEPVLEQKKYGRLTCTCKMQDFEIMGCPHGTSPLVQGLKLTHLFLIITHETQNGS